MSQAPIPARHADRMGEHILDWYDRNHRDLPWRIAPASGGTADPYRVWLSEIMLQQTRVETVRPYFVRFLAEWPDVQALAAAPLDDVLAAWAGLGYYSRARNLKRCAEIVAGELSGRFPDRPEELQRLPGIGPYTAGAIAAIAFGRPVAAIDGNVERVICRLRAIDLPKVEAHKRVREEVEAMLPAARPGDFAQALMDLGATICTPRRPACAACPLITECAGRLQPLDYPQRPVKAARPQRSGAAFIAIRRDGSILLQRRPERGLLAGMTGLPTSQWSATRDGDASLAAAPFAANWQKAGQVTHVFTHFTLTLQLYRAEGIRRAAPRDHWWSRPEKLGGEALPSLFRKAVAKAGTGR